MTGNSRIIIQEAQALGLSVEVISDKRHLFVIQNEKTSMTVCELFSMTLDPNSEAYRLSKNKALTYALWERMNIPFPQFYHFKNFQEFQAELPNLHLTFPLITKAGSGSKSINIHMDIRSRAELEKAAQSYQKSFLVQQMVTGNEYRLLIYNGKLLGALHMIPPQIIGDGVSTIQDLITHANLIKKSKFLLTESVLTALLKSNCQLESVLKKGEVLILQKNSRLSEGGEAHDCTKIVHPDTVKLAWEAVKAANLRLGGIDLICADITAPPTEQVFTFLEVNTYPDLTIHYRPTHGDPQPVAKIILQDVFKA